MDIDKKIKLNILEKTLFSVIFLFGMIWIFLIPPFQKPDENAHYFRAISVSRGEFTCSMGDSEDSFEIENSYYKFMKELEVHRVAFHYEEKVRFSDILNMRNFNSQQEDVFNFEGFCNLPAFPYIFFIVPVLLGNIFNSYLLGFFLCRLFAFFLFFSCLLWSYKKISDTRFKWVLLFFALTPMVIHQVSAIGYDYLQLSMVPILFSLNIRFLIDEKIQKRDLSIYLVSVLILLLAKPGYYALSLLYFLIPRHKIGVSKKKYAIISICVFVVYILASYFTYTIFQSVGDSQGVGHITSFPNVFNLRQILIVIKNTVSSNAEFYVKSFIGNFGWLDYYLSSVFYYVYIVSFVTLLNYLSKDSLYKKLAKNFILLLLILLLSFSLIFLVFYITYSEESKYIISGVQGRYFLSFLPYLLLLGGGFLRILSENKKIRILCVTLLILYILFEVLYAIFQRYYIV